VIFKQPFDTIFLFFSFFIGQKQWREKKEKKE